MQIKATALRNGSKIELDGSVYRVSEFSHMTPGKGRAVVRTKLKNISTGLVIDRTFSSGEMLELAEIETKIMQFLYHDGENYCFMDMNSYDQISLSEESLGNAVSYLIENMEIVAQYFNGKPIGVEVPLKIDLKVTQTVPGIRGNTVSAATKPATLETGLVIQVPMFVNEGDTVKVDTRDNSYLERA